MTDRHAHVRRGERGRSCELLIRTRPRFDPANPHVWIGRGEAYLDYTGSALYAESHVAWHAELLRASVFGNPYSDSPASRASMEYVAEARAREALVSVRGGCFCNPGAAEYAFGFRPAKTAACFAAAQDRGTFSLDRFAHCMNGRPVGAVRMSVGLATNEADMRRGVNVVAAWRDQNFTAKAT